MEQTVGYLRRCGDHYDDEQLLSLNHGIVSFGITFQSDLSNTCVVNKRTKSVR